MYRLGNPRNPTELNDDVKDIELWPCGYQAQYRVKNCKAKATTIARSIDAGGVHTRNTNCAHCSRASCGA